MSSKRAWLCSIRYPLRAAELWARIRAGADFLEAYITVAELVIRAWCQIHSAPCLRLFPKEGGFLKNLRRRLIGGNRVSIAQVLTLFPPAALQPALAFGCCGEWAWTWQCSILENSSFPEIACCSYALRGLGCTNLESSEYLEDSKDSREGVIECEDLDYWCRQYVYGI